MERRKSFELFFKRFSYNVYSLPTISIESLFHKIIINNPCKTSGKSRKVREKQLDRFMKQI